MHSELTDAGPEEAEDGAAGFRQEGHLGDDGAQDATVEERAHPLARHLYAVLRDRSVEDMFLVLNAADRRLGTGEATEKQELAFQALKLFVDEEGRFPASGEWDKWRRSNGREQLPSATFVRNAFGDWPTARAAFESAPALNVFGRRLVTNGVGFDDLSELVALTHAFAASRDDTGPLFREDFSAWLKTDGPRQAGFQKWPTDWQPFRRNGFAKWETLLRTCGLEHRLGRKGARGFIAAPPKSATAQPAETDLLVLVETWADTVTGPLLQSDFLVWWRQVQLAGTHPLAGVKPSWRHFRAFFSLWGDVLDAIGMADRAATHFAPSRAPGGRNDGSARKGTTVTRQSTPDPLPHDEIRARATDEDLDDELFQEAVELARTVPAGDDDALFAWALLASRKFGAAMSYPQYDGWRFLMQERAARAGLGALRIPHSKTLKDRVEGRSWFDVKVRARIPGAEELARDRKNRRGYPRRTVVDTVAAAMYRHGPALRPSQYEDYYRKELAERREHEPNPRLPNIKHVRETLAPDNHDWDVVVETVLRERPSLRTLRPTPLHASEGV
jgi:hypothetical protein